MVTREDFNVEDGGSKHREISQAVEEFNTATITHLNFSTYYSKLQSRIEIIQSTIDNHHTQFRKLKNELAEKKGRIEEGRLRQMKDANIIPLDIFLTVNEMSFLLSEMLAWKLIESEMMFPVLKKFANALGEVSAYEVETRVLDGMRDTQNRLLAHSENMMTTKMAQQDQKIDIVVNQIHERTDLALERQMVLMNEMLKKSQEAEHRKTELFFDFANRHLGSNAEVMRELYDLKKKFDMTDTQTRQEFKKEQERSTLPKASREQPAYAPAPPVAVVEQRASTDDKKHKCPHCPKAFKDHLQLETHIEVEHGDTDDPFAD